MKLYCYHVAPIDFWFGAVGSSLLDSMIDGEYGDARERKQVRAGIVALRSKAEKAFLGIGWEGDVREGPYFFSVPGDNQMLLGYMLKQDNNGSCFIASPIPLPVDIASIADQCVLDE